VVVKSGLTADQKLKKMDLLIRIPLSASARTLGAAIGVTHSAIQKTDWWRKNRRGSIDELAAKREEIHDKRKEALDWKPNDDMNMD